MAKFNLNAIKDFEFNERNFWTLNRAKLNLRYFVVEQLALMNKDGAASN